MKKLIIPKFKNEDQERRFWSKVNLADHFESADFESVAFPNLKPSSRPISLRIPDYLLIRIKERANELNEGAEPLVKSSAKKVTTIAMEEVIAGKVKVHVTPIKKGKAKKQEE